MLKLLVYGQPQKLKDELGKDIHDCFGPNISIELILNHY